ncbi:hypothetical protein P152DRAFT_395150, partial [Eremomyces bilateralis CBS 781.70]
MGSNGTVTNDSNDTAPTAIPETDSPPQSSAAIPDSPTPPADPPLSDTIDPEPDEASPLDTANFLSFEEWRKKNLADAGQSPDRVGRHSAHAKGSRRPPGMNAPLDSLDRVGSDGAKKAPAEHARNKDAGKTCKERFNYASFDCAATVVKTNAECRSSSAVLVENKDSYLLNECAAANKYLIVELCEDILVDTVVLANFEFFSSMVRAFRVSVSDRYPVKMDRWKELATFEARNSREIQAFLVEHPLIWARYLRIEFLSHYGNEYYCPVSLVRVHGTTMMEEFRRQEELARGDAGQEDDAEDILDTAQTPSSSTETWHPPMALRNTTASQSPTESPQSQSISSNSTSTKSRATTTSSPQPSPTTQESFFASLHKRLQSLESNSSLSLQYIESQSRILRDAFATVEKRQLNKTTRFLAHLNSTVAAELAGFRTLYDQLWQSTVLELDSARDRQARELHAMSRRLALLADELLWQKRLAVLQATLLLLCLGLLLFVR